VKNLRFALIIPAAGSGSRMANTVPKPYLTIDGKTILEHTIRQFINIPGLIQVVVAASKEYHADIRSFFSNYQCDVDLIVVDGGSERQHSIYNALNALSEDADLVAVHDAVRPFIDRETILKCLMSASETGAAITGVPAKDTIKKTDLSATILDTPDRSMLWQAQTPQIFNKELLLEAYEKAKDDQFTGTDDSSLVERLGSKVTIIEGNRENFKITYPLDMQLAELLIRERKGADL
jgi:2-C-methyl-D-erythritol 4-phosphate cytidylyltransferase